MFRSHRSVRVFPTPVELLRTELRSLAESIIDKALELHAIGGVHDRQIPTSFMCLTLKMLQLQPEKEILFEYLLAEEFK